VTRDRVEHRARRESKEILVRLAWPVLKERPAHLAQPVKLGHRVMSVRRAIPDQLVNRVRQVRSDIPDRRVQPGWSAVLAFPDLPVQPEPRVISEPLGL